MLDVSPVLQLTFSVNSLLRNTRYPPALPRRIRSKYEDVFEILVYD